MNSKNNRSEIVDVYWRTAGITIQVVRIPESEVEDRLALVSNEDGISQYEYNDFLVAKCLIDVDRIGRFIVATASNTEEQTKLVNELINHIIEVNPLLNPELLVISKNNIIKIPSDIETSIRRLVENPRWGEVPTDVVDDMIDDITKQAEGLRNFFSHDAEDGAEPPERPTVIKEWPETNIILHVIKYEEEDMGYIFKHNNSFVGPISYKMFIIARCVIDYATLMVMIDSFGISADLPHEKITDIIYGYCVEVNPFLDINIVDNNIVRVGDGSDRKKQQPTRRDGRKPIANEPPKTKSTTATNTAAEKKSKKDFSSVPHEELLTLSERIKKRVIGQDEAVEKVVEAIQIAGAGLRDPIKPLGAFMFTGDTGCGKTWLAKVLAGALCDDDTAITRVDCSEYGHSHEVSKLIGSPPGYVGFDAGGFLTNRVIERPFSVVLFDEIEKAHSKLYDILLQILDEGRLTDGKGTVVSFSDCVVIMTSNIGVKDVKAVGKRVGFGDVSTITHDRRREAITTALKRHFKPEFLNRVDSIITFNSLGMEECRKIVDLTFEELGSYLSDKKITIEPTMSLKDKVLELGFSSEYGARELKRTIEKEVVRPMAIEVLTGNIKEGSHVIADLKDGAVCFTSRKAKTSAVKVSKKDIFEEKE